jgi:signal transduction histidine kinase/DNA-directed RNA polymerase specialized sigma24 family protein
MNMALKRAFGLHRGEVGAHQELLTPFQLRTIRVGTQTTLVALLAAAAFLTLSSDSTVKIGPYFALFVSVAIAAAIVTLLPWRRLFETGLRARTQYAWTAANILLITMVIWAAGQGRSFLFLLYALPTVFSAVSFRARVQVFFLVFTMACYAAVIGLTGWDLMSLAVLGILAFLGSFLSRELKSQMALHSEARRESERRWDLVAAVAAAARNMSTVDSRGVLQTVADSIGAFGFDTACIYVRDGTRGPYRAIFPQGLSGSLPRMPFSLPPVVQTAIEEVRTAVVRGDGTTQPDRWLEAIGLQAAVAIPVVVAEGAEAVVFVGSREPAGPSPEDVEILRMLAAQASLALENAREFEKQRRDMERLAELDRLKGDFLSNVSHELRTPLTVITGMGLTLQHRWDELEDDLRIELLGRLNANAASLNDIITKLLDFSRVEAGRLEAHTQPVDLRAFLDEMVDRLQILFVEHALDVVVEEGLTVQADPVLLERIMENLLSNAAKHTPSGSRIEVIARSREGQAIVEVSDDGPGIPPEELKHVGERFFRGGDPNTRNTRGTGLGLALVREILTLHGGTLDVESTVGVGSRFMFQLALARSAGSDDKPPTPPRPMAVLSPRGGTRRQDLPGERFETVLTAARLGAEWAVAALHGDLNPKILSYLRAQAPREADTLAADVWMEIASGLGAFTGDESGFRRWVFTVARRRLQDLRHGRVVGPQHLFPVSEGEPVGQDEEAARAALGRIAALPPDEAEVVLLRVVGDLSAEDVAAVTGRKAAAVRVLQHQGLGRLTEDLVEYAAVASEAGGGHGW